ncbi:MAG: hypothetical protein ACOX0Y_03230 [Thiopseudomonas sp.]
MTKGIGFFVILIVGVFMTHFVSELGADADMIARWESISPWLGKAWPYLSWLVAGVIFTGMLFLPYAMMRDNPDRLSMVGEGGIAVVITVAVVIALVGGILTVGYLLGVGFQEGARAGG